MSFQVMPMNLQKFGSRYSSQKVIYKRAKIEHVPQIREGIAEDCVDEVPEDFSKTVRSFTIVVGSIPKSVSRNKGRWLPSAADFCV